MRAAIYTRVSKDRANGRSVQEQETECRAVCDREGWTIDHVIVDNDIGASRDSRGTHTGWAEIKTLIAEDGFDVLVC